MILDILRFARGFVRFSVSGRFPERFINITSRNGVRIWNVRRGGEGFTAEMYSSDYLRIRPLARSAGVRLRILRKAGIPQLVSRYRGRIGIAIGACAFVLTVFVMSMFIWSIDISGLDTVSLSEMQSILREHGICVGAFKPGLDFKDISRSVMLEKHEIGWMAINVMGSYASVEIKEEAPAPEVEDIYTPCNIRASRDGRILSMDVLEGTAVITEGSGAVAGQLLVSGIMGGETSGVRPVHAQARIIAETKRRAEFRIPESVTALRPTGETAERRSFSLFGISVPYVFESVDSPCSVCDRQIQSPAPLDTVLPAAIETERVYAMERMELVINNNSAEELLKKQSELYETFALSGIKVISRDYSLTHSDGGYILSVSYLCVEDIAEEEVTDTAEINDPSGDEEQPGN